MGQFFASSGQSFEVSTSTSVLPKSTQDWSPLGWTGWSSLQSKDSRESSPTPEFKSINSSVLSLPYGPPLISIHDYWKIHIIIWLCWFFTYTSFFLSPLHLLIVLVFQNCTSPPSWEKWYLSLPLCPARLLLLSVNCQFYCLVLISQFDLILFCHKL